LAHFQAQLSIVAGWNRGASHVQKELMRHASIQTTMNIYGKAMTDTRRQAHSKVVEMVFKSSKSEETVDQKKPVPAIGS
jgi:integrase